MINILSPDVVNKIAAGEVIERPASVVKELVENSLDAGATRIQVELEDGGAALVRVVDDGCGMGAADLELAFVSHATSKLRDEHDLFDVRTMGFRGEALASVGSVADVRIVSRTHDADAGHEIGMNAGEPVPLRACGAPPGTCIEVRNLFHNVPVRKKFLKTTATEMKHITEALTRLALVHSSVHFVLTHKGRDVFNLPATTGPDQRIGEFFGSRVVENLVPVAWECPELSVCGYILPPHIDRRNTQMQYTFVNRRYVRNATLMHAISEAYRGLVNTGRRPICFLFIDVDPGAVDVNVHPTKLEVKFRHSSAVHQELLAALRETIRSANLTPQVELPGGGADIAPPENRSGVGQALADFFTRGPDERTQPHRSPPAHAPMPSQPPPTSIGHCVQMLDSFIIEEVPGGINIIDQHALHERILYNSIRARIDDGALPSQQLLVPDLVELPAQEFYAVMDMQDELARFGMTIEAFGDRTVIVRSYPQILGHFDGESFFADLLADLDGPKGARHVDGRIDKIVQTMACKGAVKAGQRLTADQIRHILQRRSQAGPADTCPHGRPTTIFLSHADLDKQFHRT